MANAIVVVEVSNIDSANLFGAKRLGEFFQMFCKSRRRFKSIMLHHVSTFDAKTEIVRRFSVCWKNKNELNHGKQTDRRRTNQITWLRRDLDKVVFVYSFPYPIEIGKELIEYVYAR
jgi:hypothetical protein